MKSTSFKGRFRKFVKIKSCKSDLSGPFWKFIEIDDLLPKWMAKTKSLFINWNEIDAFQQNYELNLLPSNQMWSFCPFVAISLKRTISKIFIFFLNRTEFLKFWQNRRSPLIGRHCTFSNEYTKSTFSSIAPNVTSFFFTIPFVASNPIAPFRILSQKKNVFLAKLWRKLTVCDDFRKSILSKKLEK